MPKLKCVHISLALLFLTTHAPAQTEIDFIDFKKVKGFDSIVVISKLSKSVYVYSDNKLKKQQYFYKEKLSQFRDYDQTNHSLSVSFHTLFTIQPPVGEPYESWEDTYRIEVAISKEGKIVEKLEYGSDGTDTTLQVKTVMIYNAKGILTQEKIYNYTTGFRNVFKSNSSEFDKPHEKKDMEKRTKIFKYEKGKTTIEYIDKNKLKGKEIIEFSTSGQILHVLSLGENNKKLGETIANYDKNGKIIYRRTAWYIGESLWGDNVDFTLPGTEKISYNQKGLPDNVITTFDGQPSEVFIYKYY